MIDNILEFLKGYGNSYGLLVPQNSEYFFEYTPDKYNLVKLLTKFTGSNAKVLFTRECGYFFTDSRYLLQAKSEINTDYFQIINIKEFYNFINELGLDILYDTNLMLLCELKKFNEYNIPVAELCVGLYQIINDNKIENNIEELVTVYELNDKCSGISSYEKRKKLKKDKPILICDSVSICWIANLRGNHVENTPIVFCRAVLFPDTTLYIFFSKDVKFSHLTPKDNIKFFYDSEFIDCLNSISEIFYDENEISSHIFKMIQNKKIFHLQNEILLEKSQKNKQELLSAKKSHLYDGIAVTKLIYWIKQNIGLITEKDVSERLYYIKKNISNKFVSNSFETISGFAENGAIIHYHYQLNNKTITDNSNNNFLLIDSGGQYLYGTTDVTRTIATGELSVDQKLHYTLVLKGFINLSMAVFCKNTEAKQLDILARFHLWQYGLDYPHSTGHGIGFFLSVHEFPPSFSMSKPLLKNMIISNEPGLYIEGKYGIRIENLIYVDDSEFKDFLCFKQLTIVPIDIEPINFSILSINEKKWLYEYQKNVLSKLKGHLEDIEYNYFENDLRIIEKQIV